MKKTTKNREEGTNAPISNTHKSWEEIWEDLQSWEIPKPMTIEQWKITPQEWENIQNGWDKLADSLNPTQSKGGDTKEEEYRR